MRFNKKWGLFLLATVVSFFGICDTFLKGTRSASVANSSFSDINFYKCVVDAYNLKNNTDYDYNTYSLTDEELVTITNLDCSSSGIKSLDGLTKLTSLVTLDLSDNQLSFVQVWNNNSKLTTLDFSNNPLGYLSISADSLTTLNIENNIGLSQLIVSSNKLSKIDVSTNVNLKKLHITGGVIPSLDVSKNTALEKLELFDGKFTSLDLSNNLLLKDLSISYGSLKSLNISNCSSLEKLAVFDTNLASLDLSNNLLLKDLTLSLNPLTKIDVSKNTALEKLYLAENENTTLDVSNNLSLKELTLRNSSVVKIDVSKNVNLTVLDLYDNNISELNILNNVNLSKLDVSYNKLTKLDISENSLLTELVLVDNKLTNLDVSKNVNLKKINIKDTVSSGGNEIAELDLSNNLLLEELIMWYGQLKSLDVSKNVNLITLDLECNHLTELDISKNVNLKKLNVQYNKLTLLDVSKNVNLVSLYAGSFNGTVGYGANKITSIDLTNNKLLEYLTLPGLQLIELDLSNNDKLKAVYLQENQLTSLDLGHCKNLETIRIYSNKLTSLDIGNMIKMNDWDLNGNNYNEVVYLYKNLQYNIGDGNLKLPNNIYDFKYKYTNSSSSIASISSNGVVKGLKTGKTVITTSFLCDYNGNRCSNKSTINVVQITSNKYKINEENNYIFVGNEYNVDNIKNNINVSNSNISVDVDLEKKKLYVKYKEDVLKEFELVGLFSNKYDLNNDYIYTGSDELDLNMVNFINCDNEIIDNKLIIKKDDIVIKEYDLISLKFNNYKLFNNKIIIPNEITYDDFVNDIVVSSGITYKLYNGDVSVSSGNVLFDYTLKVYYDGDNIVNYVISEGQERLEFDDDLLRDEQKMIIGKVNCGTTMDDIIQKINTNGYVTILDSNNEIIKDTNKKIGTGFKIKIELINNIYEYTVSVEGDVTCDGILNVNDLVKLFKHVMKGQHLIANEYLYAADVTDDSNVDYYDLITMARKLTYKG